MSTGFLHFFAKKPPGSKTGGKALILQGLGGRSGGLALLAGEQLGRRLADQHRGDHGQKGLGHHIAGVVAQAVGPGGQALVQVAPDQHAGQEAAQEPQQAHHKGAEGHAHHPVVEGAGEQLGQAQRHKGQDVVQQHLAQEVEEAGHRGRIKAQQHLQQAVDKAGEQAPLDPVPEADQHEGQHAQKGDGAAVGQLVDLDVGQHGAGRDHQGAFDQDAGFGIGFCHEEIAPRSK